MRTNARLFWLLTVFYVLATIGYALVSLNEPYEGLTSSGPSLGTLKVEIVGTAAIAMLAIMSAFIAFYLQKTARTQGPVPEDNRLQRSPTAMPKSVSSTLGAGGHSSSDYSVRSYSRRWLLVGGSS
jgi:predicted acyltransferase